MFAKLSSSPVVLLGNTYKPITEGKKQDLTADDFPGLLEDFRTKLWFTYRSGFQEIDESPYRSDAGWGCMHRTGQMLLAQAIVVHLLGRDVKMTKNQFDFFMYQILHYFEDVPEASFSIHNIAKIGELQNIKIGEWFTPGAVCYALKHLSEKTHLFCSVTIYVSNNGMIYIDEIASVTDNWQKSVIILIPTRLGIDEVPPNYISVIKKLFEFPQFIGIAGGKPRSARYFLGIQDDSLLYLDPHVTSSTVNMSTVPFDLSSFFCNQIEFCKFSQVDPSMAFGFYCRNKAEFEDFYSRTEKAKTELNGDHIFSICTEQETDGPPITTFTDDEFEDFLLI